MYTKYKKWSCGRITNETTLLKWRLTQTITSVSCVCHCTSFKSEAFFKLSVSYCFTIFKGIAYSIFFVFQLHVSLDSEVPDHCGRFGLSSEENSFCSKCTHTHHLSCNDCEALTTTLKLIEDAADSITYTNQEQQDDTKYIIVQVFIQHYKGHYLFCFFILDSVYTLHALGYI